MNEQIKKKEQLLKKLHKGYDDLEAGRIIIQTIDEIFDEALAKRRKEGKIEKP